jgi:hypothetical protein
MLSNNPLRLVNINKSEAYEAIVIFFIAYFVVKFPIYSLPYLYFYIIEFSLIWLYIRLGSNYFLNFALCFLVLFGGTRVNVGVDYESYTRLFDLLYDSEGIPLTEPFTYLIVKAVKGAGFSNSTIFLIYLAVTISGIFKLLNLSTDRTSKVLSFYIFLTFPIYFLAGLNQIRQWAAIGISCYSLHYLITGRKYRFLFSILIATCFHSSALFILTYIFFLKRINVFRMVFIFVSLLILSKIAFNLIEYTPYSMYLMEDGIRFEGGNYTALYVYLVLMIVLMTKLNYFKRNEPIPLINAVLGNMGFSSIIVIIIGLFLNIDFLTIMRLNSYLIINIIIVIPLIIKQIGNQISKKIITYLLILFGSFYCFYTLMFNGEANKLVPYNFIFYPM